MSISASLRRRAALIAGLSTLAMAPLGIFANVVVLGSAGNDAGDLLRLAVVAFLLVVILDVVVAWAFARFFARADDGLPTLAAWMRVAYASILAVATAQLATGARADTSGDVTDALLGFSTTWQLGLVVFAAHLAVLAVLVVRDDAAPTLLGAFIAVAATAYSVDGIARLFLSADTVLLTIVTVVVSIASIVGEIGLGIWLLARGGRSS